MLAIETHVFHDSARRTGFDDLLFEICEELQISPAKYALAEERYKTIGTLLCAANSPFAEEDPEIYPQGSMRLGTTVHPLDGPFDLDFVCQLSVPYRPQNPMELLNRLYTFFKSSTRYRDMVDRKNRCVRLTYADDFYMDILPACRDHAACITCIQVPDHAQKCWKASNPLGFASWFQKRSQYRMYKFAQDRAMQQPLPGLEATEEKEVLQLVVQLLKRWRDLFYAESDFPPISVVLTTLAAEIYRGEDSTSVALLNVLEGIVERIEQAHAQSVRLSVINPVHPDEDFSERWDNRDEAYDHFVHGISNFAARWREVCTNDEDPKRAFKELFGEDLLPKILEKRATRAQNLRENRSLGIRPSGVITSAATAVTQMRPNTNHGEEAQK
ncbi:nucleotidyltransferase domain-containing protein [Tunturiibacter lichenicola]|uniref:nucleotidyltransferase domain-containing protein n=1 Tax=Tunturiibacter lichenicola TaxID=2051959 RepID=UPI003D9AD5F9